jgi:hypothetical protein
VPTLPPRSGGERCCWAVSTRSGWGAVTPRWGAASRVPILASLIIDQTRRPAPSRDLQRHRPRARPSSPRR